MTVSETTRKQEYDGSGSTGPFTFSFRVLDSSHISVVKTSTAGVDTTLATPADYSITLVSLGQSGGSITLTSALAVGEVLTIRGATPINQLIGYSNQGAFFPETHEQSFDKLTLIMQEVKEVTDENIDVINTCADNIDAISAAPDEAEAAAASAAKALATTGFSYTYSTTTTAADPGTGKIRFNNATLASATALYISETTANALALAAVIGQWDDSTSTIKGLLRLFKQTDPTVWAAFNVTGTITDNGTWDTITVAYVAGGGSLANDDAVTLVFTATGNKGDTGTITDGDKGDITVSGTGTVFTIDNGVVTEAKQTLADNTTNDVSTTKHGYAPKAPNDATKFLNGVGAWAIPAASGVRHPVKTGVYYTSSNQAGAPASASISAINKMHALPFCLPKDTTFTKIGVYVDGTGSCNVRLGVYSDSNGAPGSLLFDAGAVTTGSTGRRDITISQLMLAGNYWLACLGDSLTTSFYCQDHTKNTGLLGFEAASASNAPITGYTVAQSYGALPSTFGTPAVERVGFPLIYLGN